MSALLLWIFVSVPSFAGTQVNVDSMNLDDLALRAVSCDLTGGGLFASLALGAQLSSQSEAFNACHPAGAAVRLSWRFGDGHVSDASVLESTQSSADACMLRALSAIEPTLSGTCSITFLIGDRAAAQTAYAPAEQAVETVTEAPVDADGQSPMPAGQAAPPPSPAEPSTRRYRSPESGMNRVRDSR